MVVLPDKCVAGSGRTVSTEGRFVGLNFRNLVLHGPSVSCRCNEHEIGCVRGFGSTTRKSFVVLSVCGRGGHSLPVLLYGGSVGGRGFRAHLDADRVIRRRILFSSRSCVNEAIRVRCNRQDNITEIPFRVGAIIVGKSAELWYGWRW